MYSAPLPSFATYLEEQQTQQQVALQQWAPFSSRHQRFERAADVLQLTSWPLGIILLPKEKYCKYCLFFYMTEDLNLCKFSSEFLNDNENLIPGRFVQKVLLNKISNRDPEEVEWKNISGCALRMYSARKQHSLVTTIATVSYFAKEKITLVVNLICILLIRRKKKKKKKFSASPSNLPIS